MYHNDIYISPRYCLEDYLELNLSLTSTEHAWGRAINIFADRIEGRFLLLIQEYSDNIRTNYRNIDYSFSSIALCSLLIETLQQFYNGLDVTVFRGHKDAFIQFFTRSTYFSQHFTRRTAGFFYSDIRNGILHQAQTKRNTQLTFDQPDMIIEIENGIRLDVIKFKDELLNEYEHYLERLRESANSELRENFIKKMNYITTIN
jgi:hypothetical protein